MRPPEQFRDYLLVELTGWTFDEIDQASAVRLDWLLANRSVVETVKADKQKEASRG